MSQLSLAQILGGEEGKPILFIMERESRKQRVIDAVTSTLYPQLGINIVKILTRQLGARTVRTTIKQIKG